MTRACSTRARGIASVSGVCVSPIGSSPATTSPGEPVEVVHRVRADHDDLDLAPAQLAAQPPDERAVRVQRHVAAAEQDDALHRDTHAAAGRSSPVRPPRNPCCANRSARPRMCDDVVEGRDARREVPDVPREPEQERLREARVRLPARQADVAAAQVHAGDLDDPAVDHRDVRAGRREVRRGVAGLRRVQDAGAGRQVLGAEQRVGRRRQQDHGVAAAHVVDVRRRRRRHPATHLRGERVELRQRRARRAGASRPRRTARAGGPAWCPTEPVAPTTATRRSGRSASRAMQLVLDDRRRVRVAVGDADVGAPPQRRAARGDRRGERPEPDDPRTEPGGVVDRPTDARPALVRLGQQVLGTERHEHDVADGRRVQVHARHRVRRERQPPDRRVEEPLRQPPERTPRRGPGPPRSGHAGGPGRRTGRRLLIRGLLGIEVCPERTP